MFTRRWLVVTSQRLMDSFIPAEVLKETSDQRLPKVYLLRILVGMYLIATIAAAGMAWLAKYLEVPGEWLDHALVAGLAGLCGLGSVRLMRWSQSAHVTMFCMMQLVVMAHFLWRMELSGVVIMPVFAVLAYTVALIHPKMESSQRLYYPATLIGIGVLFLAKHPLAGTGGRLAFEAFWLTAVAQLSWLKVMERGWFRQMQYVYYLGKNKLIEAHEPFEIGSNEAVSPLMTNLVNQAHVLVQEFAEKMIAKPQNLSRECYDKTLRELVKLQICAQSLPHGREMTDVDLAQIMREVEMQNLSIAERLGVQIHVKGVQRWVWIAGVKKSLIYALSSLLRLAVQNAALSVDRRVCIYVSVDASAINIRIEHTVIDPVMSLIERVEPMIQAPGAHEDLALSTLGVPMAACIIEAHQGKLHMMNHPQYTYFISLPINRPQARDGESDSQQVA